MKDEEMADKHAEEYRKNFRYYRAWHGQVVDKSPSTIVDQSFKDGFLAGLKAGRPQWHKVAGGDLPKRTGDYITNIGVLTYDHYGNNIYKWHIPFCEACDYGDEVDDDEVIAWCEIPTFDKE